MSVGTLIICFGPLGRFVDALAAVQRLRTEAPHQRLTLLTAPGLVALAKASSLFDDVSTVEPPKTDQACKQLASALKKRKFLRLIDLQRSSLTRSIEDAFGFFAPPFAGAGKRSKWRLAAPPPHPVDADARLLDLIGIGGAGALPAPGPDARWMLRRRAGAPSLEPAFFGLKPHYVLLNLTREDDRPLWPATQFAALGQTIVRAGMDCAVIGTMAERALARNIVGQNGQIRDLVARADAFQLAVLGARAQAMIGHGGAAARLACAAGGRVITLHEGHEDAAATAPRGGGAIALVCPKLAQLEAASAFNVLGMFAKKARQGAA